MYFPQAIADMAESLGKAGALSASTHHAAPRATSPAARAGFLPASDTDDSHIHTRPQQRLHGAEACVDGFRRHPGLGGDRGQVVPAPPDRPKRRTAASSTSARVCADVPGAAGAGVAAGIHGGQR